MESPLNVNLRGLGEPLKQIKEFILGLLHFIDGMKKRKIERYILQEELNSKKLSNTKQLLELAKEYETRPEQIIKLIEELEQSERKVYELVDKGKITKVEIIETEIE